MDVTVNESVRDGWSEIQNDGSEVTGVNNGWFAYP